MQIEDIASDIEDRLVCKTAKLPTAPEVVLRLNALIQDDAASTDSIVKTLQAHPALVARLLQIANSAALNPPQPVTSLFGAVSSLGLSLVRTLAVTVSVSNMFKSHDRRLQALLTKEWLHSVEVSALASILMQSLESPRYDASTALVCGILHNIGSLPIIDYLGATGSPPDLFEGLSGALGAKLSVHILTEWGLPNSFIAAIEPNSSSVYGQALAFVHFYLDAITDDTLTFDEHTLESFSKTVKENKAIYDSLVGIFC